MKRTLPLLFLSWLMLFTPLVLEAQTSFLDAPAACSVALKKDLWSMMSTSSQKLAYLGLVDEKTYEVLKREADTGGSYGIISGTGNFSQFEDKRRELFQQVGYTFDEQSAKNIVSLVTSARAYDSFDNCMRELATHTVGFYAWKSSEDQMILAL